MIKKVRLQQILNDLQHRGTLSTQIAAGLFQAGEATIRRDFNELAAAGLVCRTHGGIRVLDREVNPSVPFGLREEWNSEEKRVIAQKTVEFIRSEHSVMLYGGSTTGYLGLYLTKGTIITNLPRLCQQLISRFPTGDGPTVILTGGMLDYRSGYLQGAAAKRSLDRYECDFGIASCYGMDETGMTDIDEECVELMTAMLSKAKTKIILADHTKFRKSGLCRVLPWEEVDYLITTFDPDNHPVLQAARQKGVKVIFTGNATGLKTSPAATGIST